MLRFTRRGVPSAAPLGDLPQWLSEILRNRGVDTPEKAERFLHPSLEQLYDPLSMLGMDRAVELIRQAVLEKWPIVIYGDYDCDGVCSTAILVETLREMGAEPDYFIPDRHGEGYGLHEKAVRELAVHHRLLITVDCGVTNHEEVRLAQLLGMTVIVTDHHQLAETPSPADVTLNPLLGEYPFRRLCGAGVALKLTQALLGMEAALRRMDLAALATVADLVPLVDENRVIVHEGLPLISDTWRPGLRALMTLAGVSGQVTSGQVAYRLAPRINAGGRLEQAGQCVTMLISRDAAEAEGIARHLHENNQTRQAMEAEITRSAREEVARTVDFYSDRAVIVMGEEWNSGVIGLVAGRLCEEYHYPVIALSRHGDMAVGSCRSIPGVNIHAMLSRCADLFERFGGHEQAAGLTMRADLVPELRRRLNLAIDEACDLACYIPVKEYDLQIGLGAVDESLVRSLELLQPTGYGNPAPVFLVRDAQVWQAKPVGAEGSHLRLSLSQGPDQRQGIAFRMGALARQGLRSVDALFVPELNEFMGRVTTQLNVSAIRPAGGTAAIPAEEAFSASLLQELRALAENIYQIPSEEDLPEPVTMAGVRRLVSAGRGTLVVTHRAERLRELTAECAMDIALGRVEDQRDFVTALCCPELAALRDVWHDVILLDGDLLPGEAAAIRQHCPRARLHAMPSLPALQTELRELAMEDETLRTLYRRLRLAPALSIERLAAEAALTPAQAAVGLTAFHEVGLCVYRSEPFSVALLPPVKCRMEGSATLRYIRAAAAADKS